jgi:hypothetical protein
VRYEQQVILQRQRAHYCRLRRDGIGPAEAADEAGVDRRWRKNFERWFAAEAVAMHALGEFFHGDH